MGGPTKIDSIQNVILLRSDLHDAWDSYQIVVNPDVCTNFFLYVVSSCVELVRQGYVNVPFVSVYDAIARKLHLDHIQDPNIRPLDELFRDHFLQCVLKNMKGAAEPT